MSRRARFLETVSNIFDFQRNRTGRSIILFIFGAATFSWSITTLFNLLALGVKWAFQQFWWVLIERPNTAFTNAWMEFGLAVVCFLGALGVMYWNYRRNTAGDLVVVPKSPEPHRALIMMLSPYATRISSLKTHADVEDALGEETLRCELLKSNWGPLVVAVEHHKSALQHCWVVCTAGGSESQYEVAEKVIRKFAEKRVQCHKVVLANPTDISLIVSRVSQIYKDAALEHNLEPEHIIADFTGGTAAMTGAMILATIDDNREIEYLRQDTSKPLVIDGKALSPEEIKEECILLTINTTRSLVPAEASAQN
jgi:hypothetical protein